MNKKYILILSILAIGIFALGAQLATAQPVEITVGNTTISFLPLIISSRAAEAPSGVLYVFSSTTLTDGNPGGRDAMQNICFSEDPDSHFCSVDEISNAWVETGVHFTYPFTDTWVDNPYLEGDWIFEDRSCGSWLENSAAVQGNLIFSTARNIVGRNCSAEHHIACCKRMP